MNSRTIPAHAVKTDTDGRSYIELDGQRVQFGENFNTNPVGIKDILNIIMNNLRNSEIGQVLTKFGNDLREGDRTAVLIAGTVVVGGLLLYMMLSQSGNEPTAESSANSSSKKSKKGKGIHVK